MLESDIYKQREEKPKSNILWIQLALASVALIATIISTNSPEFHWLAIIAAGLFVISLFLIIIESPLGKFIQNQWIKRKNRLVLNRFADEYLLLIEEANTVTNLIREVDQVQWGSKRAPCYCSPQNSIHGLPKSFSEVPKAFRVLFTNRLIQEIIKTPDSCLYHYDNELRTGATKFNTEQQAKTIKRLLTKYEQFIHNHNQLCERVNRELSGLSLYKIYSYELSFDWQLALPKERNS